MKFYGPWYSLSEAAEVMSIHPSELRYKISEGLITPVVFIQKSQFLIVSKNQFGQYVGHGVFTYLGHVQVPTDTISNLLHSGSDAFRGFGKIVEANKVSQLETEYPYISDCPNEVIHEWKEVEIKNFENVLVKPYQVETRSLLKDTISTLSDALMNNPLLDYQKDEYEKLAEELSDRVFSKGIINLKADAIRIAKSQIDDLTHSPSQLLTRRDRERQNQLHSVIFRLVGDQPNINGGQLWLELRKDVNNDVNRYDIDHIIDVMDDRCIEWTSQAGNSQSMKRKSFLNVVSEMKKELREFIK